MKATGVVRRIDDLGRIVIPKEIRRTMRMREGDPLEIFTLNSGEIVLKKYSIMQDLSQVSQKYAEALAKACGVQCAICDQDKIIACTGANKKEIINTNITSQVEEMLRLRMPYYKQFLQDKAIYPFMRSEYEIIAAMPIIAGGDAGGVVMLLADNTHIVSEVQKKLLNLTTTLLINALED